MSAYKSKYGQNAGYMQAFGNAFSADDATAVTAALALNDTVDLIRVPGGVRLHELEFDNGDCDTGTALVIKIGYRSLGGLLPTVDDAFGTGFTFLQAASTTTGRTRVAFPPVNISEDVMVFATVTTAAAGQSAGDKTITSFAKGITRGCK